MFCRVEGFCGGFGCTDLVFFDTHTRTSLARSAVVGSTITLTTQQVDSLNEQSCQQELGDKTGTSVQAYPRVPLTVFTAGLVDFGSSFISDDIGVEI